MTSNKRRLHSPDQIIRQLAQGHKHIAIGRKLDEVCRCVLPNMQTPRPVAEAFQLEPSSAALYMYSF